MYWNWYLFTQILHPTQAMARVWRDGQRKRVHIYRLLTTVSYLVSFCPHHISKINHILHTVLQIALDEVLTYIFNKNFRKWSTRIQRLFTCPPFKYLGTSVIINKQINIETLSRLALAKWVSPVISTNKCVCIHTRRRAVECYVESILMHGYEAWTTKIATKETGGNKKCSQKENAMNLTDK